MADDEYVPAKEQLGHLRIKPIEDGYLPVEGLFILKCLDPNGVMVWVQCLTDGYNEMEMIGALSAMHHQALGRFNSGWRFGENDHEGGE